MGTPVSGRLAVVGLGPADARWLTPEAEAALAAADALYGYGPYLDRVPARPGQSRHRSDNREEGARAAAALDRGGERDPCRGSLGRRSRRVRDGRRRVRGNRIRTAGVARTRLTIVPGVTAMLAVAARVGAPLGHDFCAISLSDNLKPWELIERRLDAAAGAGFVIALYNPASRARPWQLVAAFERLARHLARRDSRDIRPLGRTAWRAGRCHDPCRCQ